MQFSKSSRNVKDFILEQGTVIFTDLNYGKHFYIVMNHSFDQDILLLITTSQIKKVQNRNKIRGYKKETVIFIDSSEGYFPKKTAIDCNAAIVHKNIEYLKTSFLSNKLDIFPKLANDILHSVLKGIYYSDHVAPKEEALIIPHDFQL